MTFPVPRVERAVRGFPVFCRSGPFPSPPAGSAGAAPWPRSPSRGPAGRSSPQGLPARQRTQPGWSSRALDRHALAWSSFCLPRFLTAGFSQLEGTVIKYSLRLLGENCCKSSWRVEGAAAFFAGQKMFSQVHKNILGVHIWLPCFQSSQLLYFCCCIGALTSFYQLIKLGTWWQICIRFYMQNL